MKKLIFSSCFDIYLDFKGCGIRSFYTDKGKSAYVIAFFSSRSELFTSFSLLEELKKRVKTYAVVIKEKKRGKTLLLSTSDTLFLTAYLLNENRKAVCIDAKISRNSYTPRLNKIMRILHAETEDALRSWALSNITF